ncbi:MAG: cob(I)yrinic acid a,c-diamide adenosyltransferase [Patescibacteria group bacterium]
MLYIFTGNGKGKTTAALGAALRAVGDGKKVLMIQFIKGPWPSGEDESHKKLLPDFELRKRGKGFVGILNDTLPREEHERAAQDALRELIQEAESGRWNIIIADEINNALDLGLINEEMVLRYIEVGREKKIDLIFTGRGAKQSLIDKADLVTEVRDIKHPFHDGKKARRGIEY